MTPSPPSAPPAADGIAGSFFIDLSARAKLRLRGADRLRFLNGQSTNDVRRATADRSVYVCLLTAKGKLCADAFVVAGPDFLQLDAEPELREALAARLDRYLIADDVEIDDVTDALALLHWLPADAGAGAAAATPPVIRPPGADWDCTVVRSERYGILGLDFFFDREHLEIVAAHLAATAATTGIFPALLAADSAPVEARRIAAGVPRWGAELDENILLPEARLEARAVDYGKGCYVGQEIVSRLKSVGHVNRSLCRLRTVAGTTPDSAPSSGMLLQPADAAQETGAKEIGRLTSVAPLDSTDATPRWVALGYLRRGFDAPGTRLLAVAPASAEGGAAAPSRSCLLEVSAPPEPPAAG